MYVRLGGVQFLACADCRLSDERASMEVLRMTICSKEVLLEMMKA